MDEAEALRARAEKAEAALAASEPEGSDPASPTATTKLEKGTPVKSETGKRGLKSPQRNDETGGTEKDPQTILRIGSSHFPLPAISK